jgi:hypothetical protein
MRILWLSVGVAVVLLRSGEAIAGVLEDCAAPYDRRQRL